MQRVAQTDGIIRQTQSVSWRAEVGVGRGGGRGGGEGSRAEQEEEIGFFMEVDM